MAKANYKGSKNDLSWREIAVDFYGSSLSRGDYCVAHSIVQSELNRALRTYSDVPFSGSEIPSLQSISNSFLEVTTSEHLACGESSSSYRVELELGGSVILRIR